LLDGRPIVARRIRIWADGLETGAVWLAVKDRDTWVAPAAGYRGGARPDPYTYTFNPSYESPLLAYADRGDP
jgi:hypothetical protein